MALPFAGKTTDRTGGAVRVLIVDDSLVARAVLARMLGERPGFEVVAQAGSADEALAILSGLRVDVILLDLEMPGTGGLDALPELIAHGEGARILIVSSACAEGAASTVAALRLGAADTMLKPEAAALAGRFADDLADRMRRIVLSAGGPAPTTSGAPRAGPAEPDGPIACIGIGASTGGVHALAAFFRALPEGVTAPILITQHLPAPFMPFFVAQLEDMAARPVRMAAAGLTPRLGEVMLAPGNASLSLMRHGDTTHVRLQHARSPSGFLPSVDPMFDAIGRVYGAGAVGVMLSGMGRDGAAGAETLVRHGGMLWAQDAATSVVWGMPGVVANAGLAHAVLPPEGIAQAIGARSAGRSAAWK